MPPPSSPALGPFKIDAQGLLSPTTPDSFPGFAVRWRDRLIRARISQQPEKPESRGQLEITARLGRIPSTAEPAAAAGSRTGALAALRHMPGLMPQGWRLRLNADHSVLVEAQAALVFPVSAIALVTEMAMFLLCLQPYLDALDAEGLGLARGTEKI